MVRKILFLASNPTDTARLRLDKEVREVGEGLKRSNERDQFDLVSKFAVRVDDLRRGLLDYSPRIVHFSGHGNGSGGILLENEQGLAAEVPDEALAGLFELCAGQIECVILNACLSDQQANAIAKHIPYVIGMNASVSDEAALEFAVGFYDALGAGRSIKDAFQFGRNAIALKGIPEHLTPVLIKKRLKAAERQRLESSYMPGRDVYMEVSVMNEDASSWNHGNDTTLRYSLDRNEKRIRIAANIGYLATFDGGGPIAPLDYVHSPTWCAFKWDFPVLDFKVLNNGQTPLFLTEVVFDIEESSPDVAPLLTIKKDTQQRNAGDLLLVNEGWCDLTDLTVSFHLLPGKLETPTGFGPPFEHLISVPVLGDHAEVDVVEAFRQEGVDVDGLILLGNGKWEQGNFVVQKGDGSEERMTDAEMQARWKKCLGPFHDEVGTLVGEISFTGCANASRRRVKFFAPVYLANRNRLGILKPPTFGYDIAFDSQNANYQRRVQISQELQPGEADRFTVKVAVAQSSLHRFRATLRDVSGMSLQSLPIEMNCFVPRSRRKVVENAINPPQTKNQ